MKIKHLCKIFILFCLVLTMIVPIQSKTTQDKIKVGYFGYDGFIEKDENSDYFGYGVDYLNEIANYTNWEYEYVYASWTELLKMLERGEIDLLCSAQYTKERAEKFTYAKLPSGYESGTVYTSKWSYLFYEDFEAFSNMKFGMLEDSFQNKVFDEYAKKNQFAYQPVYFENVHDMEVALEKGSIDAFVDGSLRKSMTNKIVARFSIDPFYFIANKDNKSLIEEINGAMSDIKFKNPSFNEDLIARHYESSVSNLILFTKEEYEYINTKPLIRVGVEDGEPPIEYFDQSEKRYRGITVDYVELIAKKIGLNIEFVDIESDKPIDVMASQILEEFVANNEWKVTDMYFQVRNVMVVNNTKMNKAEKIGVLTNNEIQNAYLKKNYPHGELVEYRTVINALDALAEGELDFVTAYSDSVNMHIGDENYQNLQIIDLDGLRYSLGLAVNSESNPLLQSILNKGIYSLSQVDKNTLMIRANSLIREKNTLSKVFAKYGQSILIFTLVVSLFIAFLILRTRRKMTDKLAVMAYTDDLLNCYNRHKFVKEAEVILHSSAGDFALLYFNIINFRMINGRFGRETGDKLLKYVFDCLNEEKSSRKIVARTTTDHFVVLLPYSSPEGLETWIKTMLTRVHYYPFTTDTPIYVDATFGIYLIDNHYAQIDHMIDRSSLANKSLKNHRSEKFAYFEEKMMIQSVEDEELSQMLEVAIQRDEFKMYLQPKYHIETHQIYGAEALVRWSSNKKGLIFPDQFIPLFERNGFITQLDMVMFEKACKFQRAWIDDGQKPMVISCNMSRLHFDNPDFTHKLKYIAERYNLPRNCIEIEITESAFVGDDDVIIAGIHELQSLGFLVSIDDFGSGYSSLNILYRASPNTIKIDKKFLDETENQEENKSNMIISKIVEMIEAIGLETICEGVELESQETFLLKIGCSKGQGYLFSRPIPEGEFKIKYSK